MGGNVSKQTAAIVILVCIVIAGAIAFFAWHRAGAAQAGAGEKPPGMPPNVAEEFNRRMGGGGGVGRTAPSASGMPSQNPMLRGPGGPGNTTPNVPGPPGR